MSRSLKSDPGVPRTLVVIGAALGSGRWLAEKVLSHHSWEHVYLIDSDQSVTSVRDLNWSFGAPVSFGRSEKNAMGSVHFIDEPHLKNASTKTPLLIQGNKIVACLAVPPAALPSVAEAMLSYVPNLCSILVSVAGMQRSFSVLRNTGVDSSIVTGIHALNDSAAPHAYGQTLYLAPATGRLQPWLEQLVDQVGAVVKKGSPIDHDRTMAVVQALTHRYLVSFADAVTSSGLSLEHDLWPARTPLFEALIGLSARVLDTRQQATISVIQEALANGQYEQSTPDNDFLPTMTAHETSVWISLVREQFGGAFFDGLRTLAATSITAAQQRRAELSKLRAEQALAGITRGGGEAHVHVGRITNVTATTVEIEQLVIGEAGKAALLFRDGLQNARRLGIKPQIQKTEISLGHVSIMSAAELNKYLEMTLGRLWRDVRYLVPESVAGSGVLQAVQGLHVVSEAQLVDEVVRTGQRSVVIRLGIRADRSLDDVIRATQAHVASVYRWPDGVSREISRSDSREIVYLGPSGSFSETAALQLAGHLKSRPRLIKDLPQFEDVLTAAAQGAIGVIPISSSASGLVTRAVSAIMSESAPIMAGGVIDVAVRFDAYGQSGASLKDLRGADVYSHPQGLAQCRAFIARLKLSPREMPSTSAALAHVAASTGPALALAGPNQAHQLGLQVLEREVDDLTGSITRFLIIGNSHIFGTLSGGSTPTLRSVWIGRRISEAIALIGNAGPAFTEVVVDKLGNFLIVSSLDMQPGLQIPHCKYLGSIPWSPRTPIVRPGAG